MTLPLSRSFDRVVAVELNEEAASSLERSVKKLESGSIEVETGDASVLGPRLLEETGCKVVVADPPRRGIGEGLIGAIGNSKVERLVYLSCEPAVLERDLPCLEKAGFRLHEVSIVDQFPGTAHVETVVLFLRDVPGS